MFYVQGKQYKIEIDDDLDRELKFYLKDKYVFDENNCLILDDIGKYNFSSKLIYDRVLAGVLKNQARERIINDRSLNSNVRDVSDLSFNDEKDDFLSLENEKTSEKDNNSENLELEKRKVTNNKVSKNEESYTRDGNFENSSNSVEILNNENNNDGLQSQSNENREDGNLEEIVQEQNAVEIIKDTIVEVMEQELGGKATAEKINEAIDRIEIASSMEDFREKVQVDVVTFDEEDYIEKASQSTGKIILPPTVSKEEAISQVIDVLCKDIDVKDKIVKRVNFKKEVTNSFNNLTSNLKLRSVNERNLNYFGDLFIREYQRICRESGASPEDMFRDYFSNSGAKRYNSPLNKFIAAFIKFNGGGNQALRGLFEAMLVKKAVAAGLISSRYNNYLENNYRYLNTSGNGNVYFEDTVQKAINQNYDSTNLNNKFGDISRAVAGGSAKEISSVTQNIGQEGSRIQSNTINNTGISGVNNQDISREIKSNLQTNENSQINREINGKEETSLNANTDLNVSNKSELNTNRELKASTKGNMPGLNNLVGLQNPELVSGENAELGNLNNNAKIEFGINNLEASGTNTMQMASARINQQNKMAAQGGAVIATGRGAIGGVSTAVTGIDTPKDISDIAISGQSVSTDNVSPGLANNTISPNVNAEAHKMNGKNKWAGAKNNSGYGTLNSNGANYGHYSKKNNQASLRGNASLLDENESIEASGMGEEETLNDTLADQGEDNKASVPEAAHGQDGLGQNALSDAGEDLKEAAQEEVKKEVKKKGMAFIVELAKKHPAVVVSIIVVVAILLIIFLALLVAYNDNQKKGMTGSGCIGEGGDLMSFLEGWEGTSGASCTINGLSGNKAVDQKDGTLTVGAGVTNHLLSSVTEYIEANNLKGYFHYVNGKYRMNEGDCIPEEVWNELKEVGVELIYAEPIDNIAAELGLELTQYQKDAITSFNYNVGPGHTREMLEAYKEGLSESVEAGYENLWNFMKAYTRSSGSQLEGLKKRRKGEFALFVTGDYSDQGLFYSRGTDDYDNYDSESVKAREYVCQYGGSGEGLIADLNGFMQRLTRPLRTNPYYYDQNNKQLAYTALEGECAWYAGHRAKEILATIGSSKSWNSMPNGGEYCSVSEVTSGQFSSSNDVHNPRAGSLISWGKSGGYGHVAVVEQVYGDGSILISEAYIGLGMYGKNARTTIHKYSDAKTIRMKNCEGNGSGCFTTRKIAASEIKNAGWSSGYYFKCYIYLG